MKFHIENLRQIKRAEIEFGDLTIVCGKNNVGKSYLAYSIYSFLSSIRFNLRIKLKERDFNTILKTGSCHVNIEDYWNDYELSLNNILPLYAQNIARFLAISKIEKTYPSFVFSDFKEKLKSFINTGLIYGYAISENSRILFDKEVGSKELICTINNEGSSFPDKEKLFERSSYYFSMILNQHILPEIHCMTGERSGISLFGSYLREANNEHTRQEYFEHRKGKNGEAFSYPKPILDEIEMFLNLDIITKSNSVMTASGGKQLKILNAFRELAGGTYIFENGIITYVPDGSTEPIFLREVSSSVKALVGLNFYLRHQAQPGHILMIDEPELNLHPENQRKMARLLAMLVNAGIKVFITTHSDYIIREFNTLIQLDNNESYLKKLQKKEGYITSELLDASKVKAYVAERQEDGVILKAAHITQHDGITIDTLDEVIDKMNQIQDKIIWRE